MCIANTAFITTHLSNFVVMGGEKKKGKPDLFVLSRKSGYVFPGGCFEFGFLTDLIFFFSYITLLGFFASLEWF